MRTHFLLLICAAFASGQAAERPTLVTGGLTNVAGASDSFIEAITPDGRWAVLVSHANNLTTNDDLQAHSDIFVRNVETDLTLLVSVSTNGSSGGNGNSHYGSISSDGRYVIFASEASNLISNDTNGVSDVFRRDLQAGTTELVSVARSGGAASASAGRATTGASKPIATSDGRFITFESTSREFVVGDTNATGKIFLRDVQTGTTRLATAGAQHSRFGSLTENGRYLAFIAEAAQSMPGRTNTGGDVFVTDLETGQQFWASTNLPSPLVPAYRSHDPVVTPDGRTVFFKVTTSTTYVFQHDLVTGETTVPEDGHPSANAQPVITADGKTVFFDTNAADLVPSDHNGAYDVFRRNLQSGATELVSVAHTSRPSRSAMRSATFDRYMIDAAARRIAFFSPDIPGVLGDTNGLHDIFVRDFDADALYSHPTEDSAFATNSKALDPQMSASGEALILVRQRLANGVPAGSDLLWRRIYGDPALVVTNVSEAPPAISSNGQVIVYQQRGSPFYTWHDLATGLKTSITGASYPEYEPYPPSYAPPVRPVISGDQQWLTFRRAGGSVVIYNVESNHADVYLPYQPPYVDVSARPGGDLAFSGDSQFLFFEGAPTNTIYRRDLQNRRMDLICINCMNPSPSVDGNIVAYNLSPQGGPQDIVVQDLRFGVKRVITSEFTPTNAFLRTFSAPSISADGRYVVFSTTLTNALAGDFNSRSDVYVYDRVHRSTLLISRSFGEGPAAGSSSNPVLARDGRSVVFQSFANDLVEGDYNHERDIFVLKLGAGDSDNDGMDDDWEVAHFGNLNRDGAGDEDNDGRTDLQEFLAGTDPTNGGSILRVLTVTPMGGGSTTVVWSTVFGREYIVQYKDSLDAPSWSNASGALAADSASMSFRHNSSSPQRFYRVIAVP